MSPPENEILEKYSVNDHITAIRKEVTLYMCDICGKEMLNLVEMKMHAFKSHSIPSKFQCPFCDKPMGKKSYPKHLENFHVHHHNLSGSRQQNSCCRYMCYCEDKFSPIFLTAHAIFGKEK